MMVSIRILNEKGIELFRDYIIRVKVNPKEPSPIDKLSNTAWSSEFSPHIEVGNVSASTRMELGKNLVDLFGNNNFGINYPFMFTAYGIGGLIGPMLGGFIRDSLGNYMWAFIPAGVACLIGAVISITMKWQIEK